MSTSKPVFAYTGQLSSAFARQLRTRVQLEPYTPQAATTAVGVVDDGEAPKLTTLDGLNAVLNANQILAIKSPTGEQLALLQQVAGAAPGGGPAMVMLRKNAQGPGYRWRVIPQTSIEALSPPPPPGASPIPAPSRPAPAGPDLASALVRATTPTAFELGDGPPQGLVPPPGATAGYVSFPWEASCTFSGYLDPSLSQYTILQGTLEFYVYWVNAQNPPFYLVVMRQSGSLGVSPMIAQTSHDQEWFAISVTQSPNTMLDSSGNPLPSSQVSLLAHAPQTGGGTPEPIPVQVGVPAILWAKTQGGAGPVPWTAQVADFLDYQSQWSVLDQTLGANTAWTFYQSAVWNTNPWLWGADCWGQVFTGGGHVQQMPALSCGNVPVEMVTAWKFSPVPAEQGNPPLPPPSFPVQFASGAAYWIAAAFQLRGHNTPHLDGWGCGGPIALNLDLAQVASNGYWGPPV